MKSNNHLYPSKRKHSRATKQEIDAWELPKPTPKDVARAERRGKKLKAEFAKRELGWVDAGMKWDTHFLSGKDE